LKILDLGFNKIRIQ